MTRPHSVETMLRVSEMLAETKHEIIRCKGWTAAEIADNQLCRDMDALRELLEQAHGRTSTIIQELRRLTKED